MIVNNKTKSRPQSAPQKKNNNNNNLNNNNVKKENGFATPSKNVKLNLNALNLTPDANKYKMGLLNPFSDYATGSRIPDQYFAPTVTFAIREFITCKVDANGEFDIVLCPNPQFVAYSTRNSISNGTTLTLKDASTYANGNYTNGPSGISTKVSAYRVVNWGVRVRQTQSITSAQGTLTAALFVPRDGQMHPSQGTINGTIGQQGVASGTFSNNNMFNYLVQTGIPATGTGTTAKIDVGSLVDFPFHMRASCVNAAENTYEIVPKLVSPKAQGFRGSADSAFGSDITSQTSLAFVQAGDSSYLEVDGWTNVIVSGTGLVANSVGAVDLEIVYNIEGNPQLIVAGTNVVAIATGAKSAHDPLGMLLAQAALDSSPAFKVLNLARIAFKSFGQN